MRGPAEGTRGADSAGIGAQAKTLLIKTEETMIRRQGKRAGIMLALGLALWAGMSGAQDKKIVLRYGDHLPVNHFLVEPMVRHWLNAVTKNTDGTVQFEYYPGEQLGKAKDLLALTLSGVADVSLIAASYTSDKLPLTAVAELPGGPDKACDATSAFRRIATGEGILAIKEYAPLGYRAISVVVLPPQQIFSRHELKSVKSFEGMKLTTAGGAKEIMLRKLNAVPIRMGAPEIYESLSRGTIDGGILATASVLSYNLPGPAKYVTLGENFGSTVVIIGIGETRWKQLPPSVQKVMMDAGEATGRNMCGVLDRDTGADYEKLAQRGAAAVRFSAADHREIAAKAANVQAEWAEALDKRGKPGTEILKAFNNALTAGH
ncbi:MAG: C4-dicarboxylate ABC transporter [Betaproteobacteria bacterium]|nr:MAG: C4-dicarboxylate ABC transporter [Betaproteobacteria bacterium]